MSKIPKLERFKHWAGEHREWSGEFIYDPDYVAGHVWVPDPIRYPLRVQTFVGITANRGVPGFINDAMPDGWGNAFCGTFIERI